MENNPQGKLVNGRGGFVILPVDANAGTGGFAGMLSGSIEAGTSSLGLEGDAVLRVNKTGIEVNETIIVDGQEVLLKFNADETDVFSLSLIHI